MKQFKAGDIIFLTQRARGGYRGFISRSIAKVTRLPGQKQSEVKVHAAIIFDNVGVLTVREMDRSGNENIPLIDYTKKFGERMEIVSMPVVASADAVGDFNFKCLTTDVKYDYANTFVWQLTRAITGAWLGRNTPYKRMCAEDVQRMYNLLDNRFYTPEIVNPNELFNKVK
jgi:hypothetical protein